MLKRQVLVELKRYTSVNNLLLSFGFIILIPMISIYSIRTGYNYNQPLDAFENAFSTIIPLLFPAMIMLIYLRTFLQEQKNNFIFYTRPRINLEEYILSKGIANALLTGTVVFGMIFLPFVFIVYIDPYIGVINYEEGLRIINSNSLGTFSQFSKYGDFTYGFIYSLWVALNAILYSSISFVLMLILKSKFISLSVPFLFYHVFNFIVGVLGFARYSPLSTVFPFNIEKQALWTVFIPFSFLIITLLCLLVLAKRNRENWVR